MKKKKFYLMMAVIMMLSVVLGSSAFAGEDTTNPSDKCGGYSVLGYARCDASGGYARTTYGTTGGLKVTLRYAYDDYGLGRIIILANASSNNSTSVSTSRSKPSGSSYRSNYTEGHFEVQALHTSASWSGNAKAYY